MSRSIKKGPYIDYRIINKIKNKKAGDNKAIKTWSRHSVISPEMVGHTIAVHNGKEHIPVLISEDMVGYKLGEFSPTRRFKGHGGKMAKEQAASAAEGAPVTTSDNK